MKTFLFILVLLIIGTALWFFIPWYQSTKVAPEKITVTDTMVIVKDSIRNVNINTYDTIPSGFYQGMLPCNNCDGLQRTIMFANDEHFKMEEVNLGKGTVPKKTGGTWEKEKGRFVLYQRDKVLSKYRLAKDSLIATENNGIRIPDSLSKQYVLFKKNSGAANLSWEKRRSEGIDIVGNGSDPYWSIEIDNEKMILFKLAESEKPVIVPIEKPVTAGDSIVYSIVTESSALLKISISSKFCSDGVSNHLYEYKMTVWYKGQMYKGCAVILNAPDENR
jgi:uncharacterized membrane protein